MFDRIVCHVLVVKAVAPPTSRIGEGREEKKEYGPSSEKSHTRTEETQRDTAHPTASFYRLVVTELDE